MAPKKQRQQPPPPTYTATGLLTVTSSLVASVAAILAVAPSPLLAFVPLTYIFVQRKFAQRDRIALQTALRVLETMPPEPIEGGSASRVISRLNDTRRAAFLILCFNRLAQAYDGGGTTGLQEAAKTELRYFNQHVEADGQRMHAANEIDRLAERYGPILGWYSKDDGKTTAECASANGKNFSALRPPSIGWPGIVHVNCRCKAGPPHRNAVELSRPDEPSDPIRSATAPTVSGDMVLELRDGVPYLMPAEMSK